MKLLIVITALTMKKAILILICLFGTACKKDNINSAVTSTPPPTSKSTTTTTTTTVQPTQPVVAVVNVKDHGAKGDGITDDTQAINSSIVYAAANKITIVYFPTGTYSIKQTGLSTGVIPLLNGVGLKGDGSGLSHIVLSGGRYNPNSIFYQAWWDEPVVSNITIQGLDFDGNLSQQTYDPLYQYCHAFSINNGSNIEVMNCKFENFRGDGCLFGDTFESSPNLRITSNVSVHDNEFVNIYREGVLFCCVKNATFYNNYLHGNGFFVGGVDIERHSVNETVLNVSVYNNNFDFRDGVGPVERGGPIVSYRRAVTMSFFYAGYTNGIADGLAGGHQIYNNTIYQGQIDCWGQTNISITGNSFTSTYENIAGVGWLSTPAINVSDPSKTTGLVKVTVSSNIISSTMAGNGLLFNNYTALTVKSNTISGVKLDAINILGSSGTFDSNVIKSIGLSSAPVSGVVVNGNCSALVVSNNTVTDSNTGSNRSINYAVAIQSTDNGAVAPQILYNKGVNLLKGVVSQFSGQLNYNVLVGNTTSN
jgi:hypothetical protein